MIEMTTNPAARRAFHRAHEARGTAIIAMLKKVFSFH